MSKRPTYHRWYGLARWKKMRGAQLYKEPLCHMCLAEGHTVQATVANHTIAHKGDPDLFWNPDNLDSLCDHHHNSDQQSFEKGGTAKMAFGADGWPIDS